MADEMNEVPAIIALGGDARRRGRPRVAEPRSTLSTWVWAKHHDRLVQLAAKKEISVSALVRDILTKAVPVERKKAG